MLGLAIGSFLLLLAVAYMIARPLFAPEAPTEEAEESALVVEKQRRLEDIRELDLDLATGKLTEEDHRELRARSLAEAAAAMRALDEAEAARALNTAAATPAEVGEELQPEPAAGNGHASIPDDELERAIAARKRSIETQACPDCGAASHLTDHFCRTCGADLTAARTGRTR